MQCPPNPLAGSYPSYPSSSDIGDSGAPGGGITNATDHSADGYSPRPSSYVGFESGTYHHHNQHQSHVQHLAGVVSVAPPYVVQQQFTATSPHVLSPNTTCEYPGTMYDAGMASQLQQQPMHHHQQQHQEQQQQQPSPTSMASTEPIPSGSTSGQITAGQTEQQAPYQRIARFVGAPPVALACTECRSRHLKCNAGVPVCSRCLADRRECCYVKSRRGWKGTRRKKVAAAAAEKENRAAGSASSDTKSISTITASPPPALGSTCSAYSTSTSPTLPSPGSQKSPSATTNPLETLRTHYGHSTRFHSAQELQPPIQLTATLVELYYAYFHSAHPLCLPPAYFSKISRQHLAVVEPVMRFIGSFFARNAPTETFRAEAERVLFTPNSPPPKNAFTVQALTLFAIGLHSDNDQERCAEVKDVAIEMAIELGMNVREFSETSGDKTETGRVLAESWRRTWWELYFLDGLLAGFHQLDHFKLWSVRCSVPLPCEEVDYIRGEIPEPRSLLELDNRFFAKEAIVFSSFTYRVEAVRILGQVLAVGQGADLDDPMADAADTSLVNWSLHLPECKKELVGSDGRVDEMLFQAHMVINASTIYLHRPKSALASSSLVPDQTRCTSKSKFSTPTKPIAEHTAKAIHAANTISKLITLPTPLIKHTPFFTCVVTLAAIVHLSACSWLLHGDEGFLAKERIRLGVGALKTLEEVWSVAGCVLLQVKGVAREVFALQVPEGSELTGIITEEEVYRYIEEERTLEIVGGDADYHGLPALDWNERS